MIGKTQFFDPLYEDSDFFFFDEFVAGGISLNLGSEYVETANSESGLITDPGESGYTTGGVHFYGLPNGEARGAVPVYRAYSSVNTDTMLTTDPAGEAGTMGAMGFGQADILFYGFLDASDMISTLAEGEQAAPLYRYYSQSSQDHMYTLTPIGGTPILANLDLGYYDLLDTAETYLNIDFDFRRGGAGYDNTLGWYVTDTNDNPIHGRVIVENATDASGKLTYKIPADELNQYIPCRLGFFS